MSISQDSIPRSGASLAASVAAAGLTITDANLTITGSSDATKTLKFEVDGQSAGADLIIASVQTADRTATIPALAGAANFVMREAALTDNAVPRADGTTGLIQDSGIIISDTNGITGVGAAGIAANSLTFGPSATAAGAVFYSSTNGFTIRAITGSTLDFKIACADNSRNIAQSITGTSAGITFPWHVSHGISTQATAAGTTTLTVSSKNFQVFTGVTTETCQLPAAAVFGAAVGAVYCIINQSTGTVTVQRAGSDTFFGGATTDAVLSGATQWYISDGVSLWCKI